MFVRRLPLSRARLAGIARRVWRSERLGGGDLSLAVVGTRRMQTLAQTYTGRGYKTDVLAFDLGAGPVRRVAEVVVNAQLAREQARRLGADPAAELALYVVHGLLHLAGFDDHDPAEARRMHDRARRRLRQLGFRPPPALP